MNTVAFPSQLSDRRRLRVAFVLRDLFTPSVTFVVHQITGLLERGFEVDIYCDKITEPAVTHGDVATYDLKARTHFWPKDAVSGAAYALSHLPALVVRGRVSPLAKAMPRLLTNPAFALRSMGKAAAFMMGKEPDAVICHFGNHALQVQALRDLGACRAPLLAFFHGVDLSSWLKGKPSDVYKPLFERAELLLPISERWKGKLLDLGCSPDKLQVMHMGVRFERFVPHPVRTCAEKLQLFSVARLVPKKGIDVALRAIAALGEANRQVHYHIIGSGPEQGALDALVSSLNLSHCVTMHGWKTQEELLRMHQGFDVCLVPSRTAPNGDEEGIPVVLMEALASEIPVISTRHSGIPELVRHKQTGLLADEGDVATLAECLREAIRCPQDLRALAVAGRALVEREFNASTLADGLSQTVQQVVHMGQTSVPHRATGALARRSARA